MIVIMRLLIYEPDKPVYGQIYCLCDAKTGMPFYVGQTKRPLNVRLQGHINEAVKHNGGSWKCAKIRKLLESGTSISIGAVACAHSPEELRQKEIFFIKCLLDAFPGKITNGSLGGEGCYVMPEFVREKISKAKLGTKFSDETCKKLSIAKTGIKASEEAKEHMRAAQLGRKHSEETKKKMGDWQRGKPGRPISEKQRLEHSIRMTGAGNSRYGAELTDEHKHLISIANSNPVNVLSSTMGKALKRYGNIERCKEVNEEYKKLTGHYNENYPHY